MIISVAKKLFIEFFQMFCLASRNAQIDYHNILLEMEIAFHEVILHFRTTPCLQVQDTICLFCFQNR